MYNYRIIPEDIIRTASRRNVVLTLEQGRAGVLRVDEILLPVSWGRSDGLYRV